MEAGLVEVDSDLVNSSMQSTQDAKSLVCDSCWQTVFNTESYRLLCTCKCAEGYCQHGLDVQKTAHEIKESTSLGCNWCRYLYTFTARDATDKDPSDVLSIRISNFFPEFSSPKGKNTYYLRMEWNASASRHAPGWALRLHAFTEVMDVAASYVSARELQTEVHSEQATRQTRKWFADCKLHRECCSQDQTDLPSRVIEISPTGSTQRYRVIATNGERGRYAALSYCWGRDTHGALRMSNLDLYSRELAIDTLPQTLRDAIKVTQDLGIPYLWIDSLCIIQDSEDDQQYEISNMERTYRDSFLTIVAASSESATEGFLQKRRDPPRSYKIPFRVSASVFGTMSVDELDAREYKESTEAINSRAWTLQEGFLSKRYLIYSSHTLQWRCNAGVRNLGDSLHLVSYAEEDQYSESLYSLRKPALEPIRELSRWARLVGVYSNRSSSYSRDKLNAISAVARTFSKSLGPQYFAGLWQYMFIWQLTWVTYASWSADSRNVRPEAYRAPSWSWASVDGGLSYDVSELQPESATLYRCTLIDCEIQTKCTTFHFGEVLNGLLTLEGVLKQAWFLPARQYVIWTEHNKIGEYLDAAKPPQSSTTENRSPPSSQDSSDTEADAYDQASHDETGDWSDMAVFGLPLLAHRDMITMGLLLVSTGLDQFQRIGSFRNTRREVFDDLPVRHVHLR